jgi:hypothetical protein
MSIVQALGSAFISFSVLLCFQNTRAKTTVVRNMTPARLAYMTRKEGRDTSDSKPDRRWQRRQMIAKGSIARWTSCFWVPWCMHIRSKLERQMTRSDPGEYRRESVLRRASRLESCRCLTRDKRADGHSMDRSYRSSLGCLPHTPYPRLRSRTLRPYE